MKKYEYTDFGTATTVKVMKSMNSKAWTNITDFEYEL